MFLELQNAYCETLKKLQKANALKELEKCKPPTNSTAATLQSAPPGKNATGTGGALECKGETDEDEGDWEVDLEVPQVELSDQQQTAHVDASAEMHPTEQMHLTPTEQMHPTPTEQHPTLSEACFEELRETGAFDYPIGLFQRLLDDAFQELFDHALRGCLAFDQQYILQKYHLFCSAAFFYLILTQPGENTVGDLV